jgi:hypothetical protein
MEDEFERFRDDLIAYLAAKLQMTQEDVLSKLGDWLVEAHSTTSRAAGADALSSRIHSAR